MSSVELVSASGMEIYKDEINWQMSRIKDIKEQIDSMLIRRHIITIYDSSFPTNMSLLYTWNPNAVICNYLWGLICAVLGDLCAISRMQQRTLYCPKIYDCITRQLSVYARISYFLIYVGSRCRWGVFSGWSYRCDFYSHPVVYCL